jgi:ATPase subunit of ABC transporter with duplicated ATPase domains
MILAEQWGIEKELWDRPWSLLSGGESQRLSLAVAYGFNSAEVLLLDGAYLFFWP